MTRKGMQRAVALGLMVLLGVTMTSGFIFKRRYLSIPVFEAPQVRLRWTNDGDQAYLALADSVVPWFVLVPADSTGAPFWLGTREVTIAEYEAFVLATGYRTIAEREGYAWLPRGAEFERVSGVTWRNYRSDLTGLTAVSLVGWLDAASFAAWVAGSSGLPARLPTSDEWRRACHAGAYPTQPDSIANFSWTRQNATSTQEVGKRRPDAIGVYDLLGNVWEWNGDRPSRWNPRNRMLRGGSWLNGASATPCADTTTAEDVRIREPHIGFRLLIETAGR